MQYEWTPPQIFFCGHRALQLFCHNVEGDHDIKCSQKQLELKFCWFQRLGSKFTRGSIKKAALKNFGIFTGKHLCQSIFSGCSFIRKRLWHRGISVNLARLLRTHLFYRTPLDDYFYFITVAGFIFCNYVLLATFK